MPTIITQFIKELAVPLIVCTATSIVQTVKGQVKKMDDKELMDMLAKMLKSIHGGEELEFDKLSENQKMIASSTIKAMAEHKEIVDFVTTMMFMCSEGAREMDATAEDCKTIWKAILNDIALPYGIKFTIE